MKSAEYNMYGHDYSQTWQNGVAKTSAVLQKANAIMAKYSSAKRSTAVKRAVLDSNKNLERTNENELLLSTERLKNVTLGWESEISLETESEDLDIKSNLIEEKYLSEGNESSKNDEFSMFKRGSVLWFSDDKDPDVSLDAHQTSSSSTIRNETEENSLNFNGQQIHIFAEDVLKSLNESEGPLDLAKDDLKSVTEISESIESSGVLVPNVPEASTAANIRNEVLEQEREDVIKEDFEESIAEDLSDSSVRSEYSRVDNMQITFGNKRDCVVSLITPSRSEHNKIRWHNKSIQTENFATVNKVADVEDARNKLLDSSSFSWNYNSLRESVPTKFHNPPFLIEPMNPKILETLFTVQSAKALLSSYHPGLMTLDEILKSQLNRSEQWFQIQKQLRMDMIKYIESSEDYKYTTWKDTQKMLKEGRKKMKKHIKHKHSGK